MLFNPAAINKTFARVQTMERCIEVTRSGALPTLLQMAAMPENGAKVIALVALNIVALDAYLHLKNRLTEVEVDTLAQDIVEIYGGALSFADLNIILTNARRGAYGKYYERLSAADILGWVAEYYDARLDECAMRTRGERDSSAPRYREKSVSRDDARLAQYKDTDPTYRAYRERVTAQEGRNSAATGAK